MANYQTQSTRDEDELITTLLKLPAKNLESRIRQLRGEISERQRIRDMNLTDLGTQRLRLEERVCRWAYLSPFEKAFDAKTGAEQQLERIRLSISREQVDCFNDISRLNERLQEAKEELRSTTQRMRLIKSQ